MDELSATVTFTFALDKKIYEPGDRFIKPGWYPDLKFVDLWIRDWISDDFDKSLLSEQARELMEFPEYKRMRLNQLNCPKCNPRI